MKLLKEETRIISVVENSISIRLKYYPMHNFYIRRDIEIRFNEISEKELLKQYLKVKTFRSLKDVVVIFIWEEQRHLYGIQRIGEDTFFCLDYEYIVKPVEQLNEWNLISNLNLVAKKV